MAAMMAVGCDEVDENDRLIYVKPQAVGRNVLIEDFTGQRCVNCPNASEEIARLQREYGADTVIAVGIHSGPFSKSVRGTPYDYIPPTEMSISTTGRWSLSQKA